MILLDDDGSIVWQKELPNLTMSQVKSVYQTADKGFVILADDESSNIVLIKTDKDGNIN